MRETILFWLFSNYLSAIHIGTEPLKFPNERHFVGGISRPDVSRGKMRQFLMPARPSGVYLLPEFQLVSNFITGNQDGYAAPEFGCSKKGTTYLKPGIGIAPDVNDREWGIEFGGRIRF